jgi:hypothetical protein
MNLQFSIPCTYESNIYFSTNSYTKCTSLYSRSVMNLQFSIPCTYESNICCSTNSYTKCTFLYSHSVQTCSFPYRARMNQIYVVLPTRTLSVHFCIHVQSRLVAFHTVHVWIKYILFYRLAHFVYELVEKYILFYSYVHGMESYKSGLNLNTDMFCAGLLAVPSMNICTLWSVGLKKLDNITYHSTSSCTPGSLISWVTAD